MTERAAITTGLGPGCVDVVMAARDGEDGARVLVEGAVTSLFVVADARAARVQARGMGQGCGSGVDGVGRAELLQPVSALCAGRVRGREGCRAGQGAKSAGMGEGAGGGAASLTDRLVGCGKWGRCGCDTASGALWHSRVPAQDTDAIVQQCVLLHRVTLP